MAPLFWLDFRNRRYGGPVVPGVLFREDGSPVPYGDRRSVLGEGAGLVFLVHGFNVNREEGHRSLGGFRTALGRAGLQDRTLVGVLWPGDTAFCLGAFAYLSAPGHAEDTAYHLARFLLEATAPGCVPSFIAHSLGCKVVMEALTLLRGLGRTGGEVVLMAGAVDSDCLALPVRYQQAAAAARRITVLSSREDQVLRLAFPLGDALDDSPSEHSGHRALGRHGPEPGARSPLPPSVLALPLRDELRVGHGDYLAHAGDGSLNGKRLSAAAVCAQAQAGRTDLAYPDPFAGPAG